MPVGLNAAGVVGIARETTIGTYVAPTKFIPIRSETLEANNELIERRVIRNLAGVVGIVPGNLHYAGDMEVEALDDIMPYFLNASRTIGVKTGTTPNFTYTFTPGHSALPARSLSITVVRNGIVFGYVGCIIGSIEFSMDNGMLIARMTVVGAAEAAQSLPSPTWPTTAPYGPGEYTIEIPTATPVTDVDMSFSLSIEDNATPEFRLAGTREAEFSRFGERSVSMSFARDFQTRADFDAFKATPPTPQSITLKAVKTADRQITFTLPTTIKTAYAIGLASQGDLTRAQIEYNVVGDPEYTIVCKTAEDIVTPAFP